MSLILKKAMRIQGTGKIVMISPDIFEVPSESRPGEYHKVNLKRRTCPCPYSRKNSETCKHIEAAKLERARRTRVVEGVSPGKNYPNAPWYDRVCLIEYQGVRELLRCLAANYTYSPPKSAGRPPVSYADLLVCGGLARYHDDSSRFAIPDPSMLATGGYLQAKKPPKPSTLRDHMRTDAMTAMLRDAFARTADQIRPVETEWVLDSTWLHTPNSEIVVSAKGVQLRERQAKLNICAGLKTHVIVGSILAEEHTSDQKLFIPTLEQFWDRFLINTVYADAGYCDGDNYEAVYARGGIAMIDFVDTVNRPRKPQGLPHHDQQLEEFRRNHSQWLEKYGRRNLIEATNSAFKRTVARQLRSRFQECLQNEALLLVIVYNLVRLIHAHFEFGIEIQFADARAMDVINVTATARAPKPRKHETVT